MIAAPKKLLFLEDDAGDARLFEMMLLQIAPGEFEVKRVERLGDARRLLATDRFDVILSDLFVPDSKGLNTFTQLKDHAGGAPVVVFSSLDDEATATSAVQKGAEDFLMKGQVNGTIVVRALRYAIERNKSRSKTDAAEQPTHGKLLVFLGANGGVGTTTVAMNVAYNLAAEGKSVILAEFHPGLGSMALALRTAPQASLKDALTPAQEEIDEASLENALVRVAPNLRVLFGLQSPSDFQELNPDRVEFLLESLRKLGDFVLVDLPTVNSAANQVALRASGYAVVVAERDFVSLNCCRMQLEVIRPLGPAGNRVGVVVVNRSAVATPLKMPEIRQFLGCDILGLIPPASDECAAAHHAGMPLIKSHPESLAAQALAQTAARLAAEHITAMQTL
jgi:pilus assembly protein CpaE